MACTRILHQERISNSGRRSQKGQRGVWVSRGQVLSVATPPTVGVFLQIVCDFHTCVFCTEVLCYSGWWDEAMC